MALFNVAALEALIPDPEAVRAAADTLLADANAIDATTQAAAEAWGRLQAPGVYAIDGSEVVFSAYRPITTASADLAADFTTMHGAASVYADEAAALKVRLESVKARISSFLGRIAGDDEWNKDEDLVNEQYNLTSDLNSIAADLSAAERVFANALNALHGGPEFVEASENGPGEGQVEYGFSRDSLNTAAAAGDVPWASPTEWDKPWYRDVGDAIGSFAKGVWSGVTGTITGLGNMIGFGGQEAFEQTWKGLGQLATDLAIVAVPGVSAVMAATGNGQRVQQAGENLIAVGKAAVHWDEWKTDPAYAAGAASFDLAAILLTAGAGATAKVGSVASKVADAAASGSRVGRALEVSGLGSAANTTVRIAEAAERLKIDTARFAVNAGQGAMQTGRAVVGTIGETTAAARSAVQHGLQQMDNALANAGQRMFPENRLVPAGSGHQGSGSWNAADSSRGGTGAVRTAPVNDLDRAPAHRDTAVPAGPHDSRSAYPAAAGSSHPDSVGSGARPAPAVVDPATGRGGATPPEKPDTQQADTQRAGAAASSSPEKPGQGSRADGEPGTGRPTDGNPEERVPAMAGAERAAAGTDTTMDLTARTDLADGGARPREVVDSVDSPTTSAPTTSAPTTAGHGTDSAFADAGGSDRAAGPIGTQASGEGLRVLPDERGARGSGPDGGHSDLDGAEDGRPGADANGPDKTDGGDGSHDRNPPEERDDRPGRAIKDETGQPVEVRFRDGTRIAVDFPIDTPPGNILDDLKPTLDAIGRDEDWLRGIVEREVEDLSTEDLQALMELRHSIPAPGPDTVMQKVIDGPDPMSRHSFDPGNNSFNDLFNGGARDPRSAGGFISRASDAADLRTPQDVYRALRLDYENTRFFDHNERAVYAIQFRPGDDAREILVPDRRAQEELVKRGIVPADSSGNPYPEPHAQKDGYPNTGHGSTASTVEDSKVIPEYSVAYDRDVDRMDWGVEYQHGSVIWEINKSGERVLVAIFDANRKAGDGEYGEWRRVLSSVG